VIFYMGLVSGSQAIFLSPQSSVLLRSGVGVLGYDYAKNDVDYQYREQSGYEQQQDGDQAHDGGIEVEVLAQTTAYTPDHGVLVAAVKPLVFQFHALLPNIVCRLLWSSLLVTQRLAGMFHGWTVDGGGVKRKT
jgi:hypothetical protein